MAEDKSTDIVERLENVGCDREPFTPDHATCICRLTGEAADLITRLRSELQECRFAGYLESEARANAALIVRAVNSHDALVEAARIALEQLNSIMNVRMPGHAAGALVHAREQLKEALLKASPAQELDKPLSTAAASETTVESR